MSGARQAADAFIAELDSFTRGWVENRTPDVDGAVATLRAGLTGTVSVEDVDRIVDEAWKHWKSTADRAGNQAHKGLYLSVRRNQLGRIAGMLDEVLAPWDRQGELDETRRRVVDARQKTEDRRAELLAAVDAFDVPKVQELRPEVDIYGPQAEAEAQLEVLQLELDRARAGAATSALRASESAAALEELFARREAALALVRELEAEAIPEAQIRAQRDGGATTHTSGRVKQLEQRAEAVQAKAKGDANAAMLELAGISGRQHAEANGSAHEELSRRKEAGSTYFRVVSPAPPAQSSEKVPQ